MTGRRARNRTLLPTPPAHRWRSWTPVLSVLVALVLAPFAGFGADAAAGPDDEVLRDGAAVYSAVCSSCHQPGGVGLAGDYPPLIDNPHVDDAEYVETVIRNGRTGEIVVNGVTYDGIMPAQSTLSDDDIAAVIVYIQSGFAAPAAPAAEISTGPVAGTELPILANYAWIVGLLLAVGVAALVLGPRVIAAHDRRELTWVDAWMKTAVIVVALVVSTTWLPARVLEIGTVQDLPKAAQDLIAVSIWIVALVASAWGLWYAHRDSRI
jgi:mono/diheme cytochrome c family protein